MVNVITLNVQRKPDRQGEVRTLQAVRLLRSFHQDAVICLQECTPFMKKHLTGHGTVAEGENMILLPSQAQFQEYSIIPAEKNSRSFLQCQALIGGKVFSIITGKLPHGISPSVALARKNKLLSLLSRSDNASHTVVAVDTNAFFSGERNDLFHLAGERGFLHTSHPTGTHHLGRLESKNMGHKILALFGRVFRIRSELDFIFYDSSLRLQQSRILDVQKVSDHLPVLAQFQ